MFTPAVGSRGVTTTEVTNGGRVEVGGSAYEASTPAAPIPAGEPIAVVGWRLDDRHGAVLFVCRASEVPAPTLDERLVVLERWAAGFRSPRPSEAKSGQLLLTFGQVVSAVGCVAAPMYALAALWSWSTSAVRERVREAPDPTLWIVGSAVLGFLYSATMFVVFTRCKRVPAE